MGEQKPILYTIWTGLERKVEQGFYDLLSTHKESEVYILPTGQVHLTRWQAPKNAAASAKVGYDGDFMGEAVFSMDRLQASRGLVHLWRNKNWWPLMQQLVLNEEFAKEWGDLWDILASHKRFEGIFDREKGMMCAVCAFYWAAAVDIASMYRQLLFRDTNDIIPVDEFTAEAAQHYILHGTCIECGTSLGDGLCACCREKMAVGLSTYRKGTGIELLCWECHPMCRNRGK